MANGWKEMSKYISKSKLVETLTKYKFGAIKNNDEREYTKEMVLLFVNSQPTISEKEMIRKTFERVIERLEQKADGSNDSILVYEHQQQYHDGKEDAFRDAIEIIKEECGINE